MFIYLDLSKEDIKFFVNSFLSFLKFTNLNSCRQREDRDSRHLYKILKQVQYIEDSYLHGTLELR